MARLIQRLALLGGGFFPMSALLSALLGPAVRGRAVAGSAAWRLGGLARRLVEGGSRRSVGAAAVRWQGVVTAAAPMGARATRRFVDDR